MRGNTSHGTRFSSAACAAALALTVGCGGGGPDGGGGGGGDGEIESYVVSGTAVDFATGDRLSSATVSTVGLTPSPTVSVSGASFTIEGIPPFSVFHILAGSPPGYRSTYNVATEVEEADLTGVELSVLSEDYLAGLAEEFGVAPSGDAGVLVGRLVDASGEPLAGVPGTAFDLPDTVAGPFFLDAERQPDAGLSESSASGYFVLFEVPSGLVSVAADEESGYGMSMPDSPAAPTAATLAEVVVTEGEVPELPVDVSFENDVAPIFEARGCTSCHDGGGIGKDLGDLHLNGQAEKMHREITEEISPTHGVTRVDVETPESSLLLTMPSAEDPPDVHPNVTFASSDDPDYLTILAWITEGALKN